MNSQLLKNNNKHENIKLLAIILNYSLNYLCQRLTEL